MKVPSAIRPVIAPAVRILLVSIVDREALGGRILAGAGLQCYIAPPLGVQTDHGTDM